MGASAAIICVCVSARRRVQPGTKYLDIRVTLHHLFNPCERQRRVSIIGRLLLSGIDLSLPERTEKLVEWFTGLDIRRRGRHWRSPTEGFIAVRRKKEEEEIERCQRYVVLDPNLSLWSYRENDHGSNFRSLKAETRCRSGIC